TRLKSGIVALRYRRRGLASAVADRPLQKSRFSNDTEGVKQEFARDVIECPVSRLCKDSLKKQSTTTVIVPNLSPRSADPSMRISLFFGPVKGTFSFHSRPADIASTDGAAKYAPFPECIGQNTAETNRDNCFVNILIRLRSSPMPRIFHPRLLHYAVDLKHK